jgi:elongation factor Ts
MSISAKDVKRLRDATGVGMMDCKEALQESDGDFDQAVQVLRKKGRDVATDRADREAEEGLVVSKVAADGQTAAVAEVNCETDFVARNDDFREFANGIVNLVLERRPEDLDALLALPFQSTLGDDATVERALTDLTGRIGEKIAVRRFHVLEASNGGEIVSYVHPGSRLGVLVDLHGNGNAGDLEEAGRDVAMQVAALDPIATRKEDVPEEVRQEERNIARDAAQQSGKPEHVLDNIVEGKLRRFFEDNVLLEQSFVKDASKTVREHLDEGNAQVERFVRYALGD